MSQSDIKAALIQHYLAGRFGLKTAYENREFEPQDGTPWARLTFIPAQPSVASLGDAGEDLHSGVFQIDLFYPSGTGDGEASTKADAIRASFRAGFSFSYNGQVVTVRSCGRGSGRPDPPWYRLTISVTWYAYTRRNP